MTTGSEFVNIVNLLIVLIVHINRGTRIAILDLITKHIYIVGIWYNFLQYVLPSEKIFDFQ